MRPARCFDSMYARYMSFKACFTWHKFYTFCLWRAQTERISSFSRQTKKSVQGSTLIKDNAENGEIIILRRVVPCKLRVFELFKIIKNNRRVPGFI